MPQGAQLAVQHLAHQAIDARREVRVVRELALGERQRGRPVRVTSCSKRLRPMRWMSDRCAGGKRIDEALRE